MRVENACKAKRAISPQALQVTSFGATADPKPNLISACHYAFASLYVESICTMTQSIAHYGCGFRHLRPHVGATKSGLWGYDPKDHVSKQTVNTWQHQLLVDIVKR